MHCTRRRVHRRHRAPYRMILATITNDTTTTSCRLLARAKPLRSTPEKLKICFSPITMIKHRCRFDCTEHSRLLAEAKAFGDRSPQPSLFMFEKRIGQHGHEASSVRSMRIYALTGKRHPIYFYAGTVPYGSLDITSPSSVKTHTSPKR